MVTKEVDCKPPPTGANTGIVSARVLAASRSTRMTWADEDPTDDYSDCGCAS